MMISYLSYPYSSSHVQEDPPKVVPLTPTDECSNFDKDRDRVEDKPLLPPVVQPPGIYNPLMR